MSAGVRVELQGLSRTEMNGLVGTAMRELDDGRWAVSLRDGRELSLKTINLSCTDSSPVRDEEDRLFEAHVQERRTEELEAWWMSDAELRKIGVQ